MQQKCMCLTDFAEPLISDLRADCMVCEYAQYSTVHKQVYTRV